MQLAARKRDRVEDVAQPLQVGRRQRTHSALVAQRPLERRALALREAQSQPHRVGHREDVGKDDRGVERKAPDRLQRHLACELGRLREREEASGLEPRLVVFGEVAPRLPHDPHRRVRRRLAQQCPQEDIVRHGGRFSHGLTGAGRGRRESPGRSAARDRCRCGRSRRRRCARRCHPTPTPGARHGVSG